MKRLALTFCLIALVSGTGLLVGGCDHDREVEHDREVRMNRNGSTETRERSVREDPNGTRTTEEEHSTTYQR
jgi:hypothetical protein